MKRRSLRQILYNMDNDVVRMCLRKVKYGSKLDAEDKAKELGIPLRVYKCPNCFYYHLTKSE